MSTFLISREIEITRQEGDVADVVITVPALLSMTGRTVKFQIRDSYNQIVLNKSGLAITVNGQVISIALAPADTAGKAGRHHWELEVSNSEGPITIGKGPFIVEKTDI